MSMKPECYSARVLKLDRIKKISFKHSVKERNDLIFELSINAKTVDTTHRHRFPTLDFKLSFLAKPHLYPL